MAHDTMEIYVRDLTEDAAADWLRTVFEDLEQVREAPIVTYEGHYRDATVPVQITEQVKNGPYTSLWFNAPELPWESVRVCARAAHEAIGAEVLCYPEPGRATSGDEEEWTEPWTVLRVARGEEEFVDERTLDL